MTAFHERVLARLPLSVLRSVAKRMGVEDADALDREALIATLSAAPAERAAALAQSLRRLAGRLPGGVLRTPDVPEAAPAPAAAKPRAAKSSARKTSAAAARQAAKAAPAEPGAPLQFETLSMVDLLLRQGYVEKAREMLGRILERQPDNAEARKRLDDLQGGARRAVAPTREAAAPPGAARPAEAARPARVEEPVFRPFAERPPEPIGLLDFEEPPLGYGRVYAGLLTVEPTVVYAYWEVTHDAVEAVRRKVGDPDGRPMLRLVSHHGEAPPGGAVRDVEVTDYVGEYFFVGVHAGARHRLAVGIRARSGFFEPICHTGMAATAPAGPSADTREVWMEVEPPAERPGAAARPIRIVARSEGGPEEALLARARRIGLASLPEEAQRRILSRLHGLLRTLGPRPAPLPTSPAAPLSGRPNPPAR